MDSSLADAIEVANMMSTTSTVGATKYLTNRARVNRVMSQVSSSSSKKWTLDENTVDFVAAYSVDMANRILEEAAALAKHRNATTEIDSVDLNFVLMKKFNIAMPPVDGAARVLLHKETTKAALYVPKATLAVATASAVTTEGSEGGPRKRKKVE